MNNINVLIVEDESLIALELMQEEEINLILMDINLKSDTTGIELYKSFQTDIPVIYITAYNDEKTIQEAIETNPTFS